MARPLMRRRSRSPRGVSARLPLLGLLLALLPLACGGDDGSAAWEGDEERMEADERQAAEGQDRSAEGASPWEDARRRGVDFRALGQEPGWFVEIDHGNRTLVALDYGQRRFTVPTPEPEHDRDGRVTIYRVEIPPDRVVIEITREACQDIMSGEEFEASVSVVVDGEEFRGCGRALE